MPQANRQRGAMPRVMETPRADAVALHRLAHVQPLLDFPDPRRHRMHHRHLQILLQHVDDVERAPAGAEHVDGVGAFGLRKFFLMWA